MSPNNWIVLDGLKAKLLLALVCIGCYANTMLNEYSFDDDIIILNNEHVQKGIRGIPGLFTSPYYVDENMSLDYRPLSGTTFAIENQFFGNNPKVSHFTNLAWYVFLILVVFTVMRDVFRLHQFHPALPFLVALLYAVHPVHTEVVASIKNRDEIMSLSFALLALYYAFHFFISADGKKIYAGLSLVFMIFSLISKSSSLPVTALILLMGFYYGFNKKGLPFYIFLSALFVMAIAYFSTLLYFAQRTWYALENPLVADGSLPARISIMLQSLLFYFKFLFYPFPFRFYYGYNMIPIVPLSHPSVVFSFLIHLALFISGFILIRKKKIAGLFVFGYFFYIANYANITIYPGIVSERALFAPSLWFITSFIMLAREAVQHEKIKRLGHLPSIVLYSMGIFLLIASIRLTIHRNFQWKDTLTLMSSDIKHLENSVLANYLYANVLSYRSDRVAGKKIEFRHLAKKHYKRSAELAPNYYEPHLKLGMIYEYEEQNRDSAFYFFKRAYEINPESTVAQFQFAKQCYLQNDDLEAEKLFSSLYSKLPNDAETLFFYAQVLYNSDQQEKALKINDELFSLSPDSYYPYYNYGMFRWFAGDSVNAAVYFEKAIQKGYRENEVYNLLMKYYIDNGMSDKATALKKVFEN